MIKTCLKEAATPTSPSRPVSASDPQETVTPVSHVFSLSEVSASFKALNIDLPMWYIEPRLATLQELVGVRDLRMCGTVGDPRRPRLTGQRGMPPSYSSKSRWDPYTSYCPRTTLSLWTLPSRP